ncbi:type IV pilin protein [Dasania marina]|uniref:type IV pilin protein n=1 Tax=Dasania marina TaxID=471499 RepID=UPI000478489E|nr:type IV pilin protein [Dasania marina]
MYRNKGFTLIEIMIVLAIIAILATIANSSYQSSVIKSCRADGRIALTEAAARQERLYSETLSYVDNSGLSRLVINANGSSSPEGCYTMSVTNPSCGGPPYTCFTVTATAAGKQVGDTECATLSINNLGQKTSTGGGTRCW